MTATNSTAYSRDLGDELRRLRQRFTGLRGRAMAHQLGWDPSKVSNLEHGKIKGSDLDLAQYLTACGKDLDYFEDFTTRYQTAFAPYLAQAPDNVHTLTMTESTATTIRAYDVLTVNPLLRTPAYAQALEATTGRPPGDTDRQAVLRRPNGPKCVFYLHELALRLHIGNAQVMADQHRWLLANSAMLRIVPVEATTAAFQSACTLFEFDKAPPLVHWESDVARVFAQGTAAVDHAHKLFELLDSVALDHDQTKHQLGRGWPREVKAEVGAEAGALAVGTARD
ncbi:helix-turn-helix domain-containing protein [Lentzea sp. JNUCC 0626]|uniref:helix-turn-helix domain-containing protein n=1 Tax=Lentzea sp. JNUCC 0626 TaxID=3367513 RepID=UPI00374A7DC0